VLDSGPQDVTSSLDTARPAYGKAVTVRAKVTEAGTTAPVADQAVALQEKWWGGWETVDVAMTGVTGEAQFKVYRDAFTELRVASIDGIAEKAAAPEFSVKPMVAVSAPKPSTATIRKGKAVTYSGTLNPAHAARSKTVQLKFYRLVNKKWVLRRTVSTVNANGPWTMFEEMPRYSKYSASARMTEAGKWRVVAVHPEDEMHAATSSSATYFTVR